LLVNNNNNKIDVVWLGFFAAEVIANSKMPQGKMKAKAKLPAGVAKKAKGKAVTKRPSKFLIIYL